jgi:hypothetical protein
MTQLYRWRRDLGVAQHAPPEIPQLGKWVLDLASGSAQLTEEFPEAAINNSAGGSEGAVAGLVGIGGGVVSGEINLESSGVEASDWRPRHAEPYHEA